MKKKLLSYLRQLRLLFTRRCARCGATIFSTTQLVPVEDKYICASCLEKELTE